MATAAEKNRNTLAVPLMPATMKTVKAECAQFGMSQREMVRRLIEWFASQDDVVRGSVLGTLPESIRVDVAKMALQKLATSKSK